MVEHDSLAGGADERHSTANDGQDAECAACQPVETEYSLIVDVLTHCASTLDTERARFIRRLAAGDWQVHSLQNGVLVTHQADHAEVAMAWMVGLSRFPIRVTRPRVTHPDGSGVRPIAVASYLGIPVLCQDEFVGVVELAGTIKGDLERVLDVLAPGLSRFGERLTYDPSLRAAQLIDLDVECALAGGFWAADRIRLTAPEWQVVHAIDKDSRLRDVLKATAFSENELIELIRGLLSRGLVTVRATTRVLKDDQGWPRSPVAVTSETLSS